MYMYYEFHKRVQRIQFFLKSLGTMYLLSLSPLWVITSVNLLLDNLRLHFTFAQKLPLSNCKR